MGCKIYSNITCPTGATENTGKGLHYLEIYSM